MAVIAHVDRAFSYGFEDVMGAPRGSCCEPRSNC
jgi:hypothetical protein